MQEAISTGTVNTVADNWRPSLSASETQRDTIDKSGDGVTYTLNKITATAAEHETYRAAHSTWGSVTYTLS
jgi:flagellar capping protein FliD